MTEKEADEFQEWKGMAGSTAYHLIDRHAEGWEDTGLMMEAWLRANGGKTPMTSVAERKLRSLEAGGWVNVGVILVEPMNADGRHNRCTLDHFGRVQHWQVDGSGKMHE